MKNLSWCKTFPLGENQFLQYNKWKPVGSQVSTEVEFQKLQKVKVSVDLAIRLNRVNMEKLKELKKEHLRKNLNLINNMEVS